jgi:hypothetical protein
MVILLELRVELSESMVESLLVVPDVDKLSSKLE